MRVVEAGRDRAKLHNCNYEVYDPILGILHPDIAHFHIRMGNIGSKPSAQDPNYSAQILINPYPVLTASSSVVPMGLKKGYDRLTRQSIAGLFSIVSTRQAKNEKRLG
jgi:hypothetical protein